MSTDESSAAQAPKSEAEAAKKPKDSSKGASGSKTASNQPTELDEEKINAPTRQELIMLGVICVATLILWAAGRAACNYQVAGEGLTPRKVSLEERTLTPKDVGMEFGQALGGGDFATAAQLARGEAAALVQKEKSQCGECTARKVVASKLLSMGTVLKANVSDTIVSVKTIGGSSGEKVRVLGIERDGRKWFVTRVYASAAEAQLKEPPAGAVDALLGPASDGAPAGSALPSSEQPSSEQPTSDPSAAASPAPTSSAVTSPAPAPSAPTSAAPAPSVLTPPAPAPSAP